MQDLAQQPGQQRDKGHADQGNAAARDQLFYTQLGVKLCSMAGGGVQKIYMVFLREPSRRNRSGSDLFHLRDGFEIRVYLKTVNMPKQRVFSACCAPFSLVIHKVFLRKNGFIRRKSLAVGHIADFQIDPKAFNVKKSKNIARKAETLPSGRCFFRIPLPGFAALLS